MLRTRTPLSILTLTVILVLHLDLSGGVFDLEYPIVFSDLFSESDSHFGLSVSLIKSNNLDNAKGWILIGAPKSNSTDPSYKAKARSTSFADFEPGAIWRCSLGRRGNNESCEILNLDPHATAYGQDVCSYKSCADYPKQESKYSNWLGVSMSSIGDPSGKFVACAHRWIRGNGSLMNGMCYFLSTKDINRNYDGIRGETPVNLKKYDHRLAPIIESASGPNQYFLYSALNESRTIKWALGQAGMSTHMSRNEGSIELLLGAPGVYVWSGAVIRYQDGTPNPGPEVIERKNRYGAPDFSSYMISYRPPSERNATWHDYFGYAVTSGKFDSTGETLYVGGAPRGGAHLNGEVVIFKFPILTKKDEIYILDGEQIASYFGSVLLAVDTNGDGLDELFVAAPQFSRGIGASSTFKKGGRSGDDTPEGLTSRRGGTETWVRSGDHGCVYIYSGIKQLKGETEPQRLYGDENQSAGARFGSAMTSLGDISGDGLKDIAIGAPYENEDSGAVYIYYGVKNSKPQLMQKITPENINHALINNRGLAGFGSSFSGEDIDNNGVPDLAIGSYLSKQTVLLRSRPIIEVAGLVRFSFGGNSNVSVLPRGQTTFNVASAVRFVNKLGRSQQSLRAVVKLTFDAKFNRFRVNPVGGGIRPGTQPREWEYEDLISSVESAAKYYSFQLTLIKEHNSSDPNIPPFIVQQKVIYNDITQERPKGARYYEIFGNKDLKVENRPTFDDFCSNCVGKGETNTEFTLILTDEECIASTCTPKLKVYSWFRLSKGDNSPIEKFVLGSAKEIILEILVKNEGQTATRPIVDISWDKNLKPGTLPNGCTSPGFTNPGYLMSCSIGEHLRNGKELSLPITFNMESIFSSVTKDQLSVVVDVFHRPFADEKHSQDQNTTKLELSAHAKVNIIGWSKPKRIVWNSKFQHVYDVILEGPSPVKTVSLNFKIPVNKTISSVQQQILLVTQPDQEQYRCIVKSGSYAQIRTTTEYGGPDESTDPTIPPDADYYIPGADTDPEIQPKSKVKRDVSVDKIKAETKSKVVRSKKSMEKFELNANTFGFDCGRDSSIQCMEVECTASNVFPGDVVMITFDFSIVNETAFDLLKSEDKEIMLIESQGSASIGSLGPGDHDTAQTLLETFQKKEVEVWVYIVAAIGGILILVVLITVLYKFGFFKRDTKKQLDELKAARDEARQSLLMTEPVQYQRESQDQEPLQSYQEQENTHKK